MEPEGKDMFIHQTTHSTHMRRLRRLARLALLGGFAASLTVPGWSADVIKTPSTDVPSETKSVPEHKGTSGGGGGFSIGIDLGCLLTGCGKDRKESSETRDARLLAASGPMLPEKYSMSGFVMQGLVKGGAPFVLDYDASQARLRIEMKVQNLEPFVYTLKANGRAQKIFKLPESFGTEPRTAVISVHAIKDQPGPETPAPLRILGMGMGERAVGSVAIDQVSFGPPEVRIGRFEKARYSFHSRSDFNKVVAEFARAENRNGTIQVVERVNQADHGELTRDSWVGRDKPRIWDGKDPEGEISNGLHMLKVRAWRSSVKEGDWVVSWSPDWVDIKR
jgi:hypothetical protein